MDGFQLVMKSQKNTMMMQFVRPSVFGLIPISAASLSRRAPLTVFLRKSRMTVALSRYWIKNMSHYSGLALKPGVNIDVRDTRNW